MERAELVKKLENVSRALAKNDLVPIWKSFCFNGEQVIAWNDSVAIIAPCKTDVSFVVAGKVLLDLLTASQSEEVDFKIEGYSLVVRAGRSVFTLPFQSTDDYLFEVPREAEFDLSIRVDGFKECLLTSSKDSTQPAFMGILQNGSLYSSDGDSLTRLGATGLRPDNQLAPYMMSNEFCETVLKLSESEKQNLILLTPGWAPGEDEKWGAWACARLGDDVSADKPLNYEVWGRLIDPPSIDFETEITNTIKGELTWVKIPGMLKAALDRARCVADTQGRPTELLVKNGKLHLTTDVPGVGEVKDVLTLGKHPEVTALVSAELLQRSIGTTEEMVIFDNCCCFRKDNLFVLLSNFG